MGRTRRTVTVATAIGQRAHHRTKIKTADSKLARQFVTENLCSSSQGQKKSIDLVCFNELSQILLHPLEIGIEIAAVVANLVIEEFRVFRPVCSRRPLKPGCP